MTCKSCGAESHKNQIKDFPVGVEVQVDDHFLDKMIAGRVGEVVAHLEDGRTIVRFGQNNNTFYFCHPEFNLKNLGARVLPTPLTKLLEIIDAQAAEIEYLKARLDGAFEENLQFQDSMEARDSEILKLRLELTALKQLVSDQCDSPDDDEDLRREGGELEGYFGLPEGYAICKLVGAA